MSKKPFDGSSGVGKLIGDHQQSAKLHNPFIESTVVRLLRDRERFEALLPRSSALEVKLNEMKMASQALHLGEREFSLLKGLTINVMEEHKKLFQSFEQQVLTAHLPKNTLASNALSSILKSSEGATAKHINPLAGQASVHGLTIGIITGMAHSAFQSLTDQGSIIDPLSAFGSAKLHDFLPTSKAVISSFGVLEKVWPSATAVASASLEGMAGLMSLKNAISESPFSAPANLAVKSLLGDWNLKTIEASALADWSERRRTYFEQGFDPRLTAFPERIYTSALYQAGLLRADLLTPVFPQTPIGVEKRDDANEDELSEVKSNLILAYEIISNLEMQLRAYIEEKMESQYGKLWYKQRVPGDVYQQWKEKKATALKKKEEPQPILSYADFTDYERVITRKDNWGEAFQSDFFSLMDLQVSFQRLYTLRICTMHVRPVNNEDLTLLTVEARRILKAMGRLSESE